MDTEYHSLRKEDNASLDPKRRTPPARKTRKKPSPLFGSSATVIYCGLATILPMIFLSALLLGLVRSRLTRNEPSTAPEFVFAPDKMSNPSSAYYVDISATSLLTISAWSSTMTPLLGIVLMELWSYQAAFNLHKLSQTTESLGLPSPYQFALLIDMLKDTWLHVTTHTVSITQSLNAANSNHTSRKHFGLPQGGSRDATELNLVMEGKVSLLGGGSNNGIIAAGAWSTKLAGACFQDHQDPHLPCSLDTEYIYDNAPLRNSADVARILANSTGTYKPQLINYKDQTIVYLAPGLLTQQPGADIDFTGMTYGASTECKPMSKACGLHETGEWLDHLGEDGPPQLTLQADCKDAGSSFTLNRTFERGSSLFFNHTLYSDDQYANQMRWNLDMTIRSTNPETVEYYPTKDMVNPSFPAAILVSETKNFRSTAASNNIAEIGSLAQAMITFCKHTIYDLKYSYINNTYSITDATVSNKSVAEIANIPVMLTHPHLYFRSQVDYIMAGAKDTDVSNTYALAYSQASMAILGGALEPTPASNVQYRRSKLVSRVPKAPLYTLICLNLLYAVLGLALTILALLAVKSSEIVDVQARLGVAGLVAECFEKDGLLDARVDDSKDLFGEKEGAKDLQVCVQRSVEGGWRFKGYDMNSKADFNDVS